MSWHSKLVWSEGLSYGLITCSRATAISSIWWKAAFATLRPIPGASRRSRSIATSPSRASSVAPGHRRHAGRHAVRSAGRQPAPPPDRRAGDRGQAPGVAHAAGRRAEHPGGGRRAPRAPAVTARHRDAHRPRPPPLRVEEEIDIAHPRLSFELRKTAKPGYSRARSRASSRCATRRSSSTKSSRRRC